MSLIERARQLRSLIETMAQGLEDTIALENIELFPMWEENKQYEVDIKVRYNNILYKCLQPHNSIQSWNPTDAVSLWAKVLIPDPEIIPEWEQPGSTNPYMKDDKVKHLNKTWISIIDYNVYEPGIYGWNEIS